MDAAATIHLIAFPPIFLRVSFLLFIGKEKLSRTDEGERSNTLRGENAFALSLKWKSFAQHPTHVYFSFNP